MSIFYCSRSCLCCSEWKFAVVVVIIGVCFFHSNWCGMLSLRFENLHLANGKRRKHFHTQRQHFSKQKKKNVSRPVIARSRWICLCKCLIESALEKVSFANKIRVGISSSSRIVDADFSEHKLFERNGSINTRQVFTLMLTSRENRN